MSSTFTETPAGLQPPVAFAPPLLGPEEIAEVVATLESGWLTTGPRVAAFERAFAAYTGATHAVAVSSCTAALHLSMLASEIGAGDEVITTPLTFCATANTIVHTGATPVFADVDASTQNLDPGAVAAVVTSRTRALLPVHFAGRPANVEALASLAHQAGIVLIEDAAHCVEGIAGGRKVGSIGDFSCFSFYATKNLTTGEGGMVTTRDGRAAAFMRTASLHGISRDAWMRYAPGGRSDYDVVMAGYKYNMMDIQAAIGLHQLASLDDRLARRDAIWTSYDEAFADLPLRRPAPVEAGDRHARHLYAVGVDTRSAGVSRDVLQQRLAARGISTSVHFRALHLQPFYQERYQLRRGMFPAAELVSDTTLSLPLSAGMTPETVARVIEAVHASLR
jgi:dTDP-4-amino-4,6-dideoxygalactose transaminase